MARTYHRDSKGRFARAPGGGATKAAKSAVASVKGVRASRSGTTQVASHGVGANGVRIQTLTGGSVSTAEAARIMFGSAGARKKIAASKKRKRRR